MRPIFLKFVVVTTFLGSPCVVSQRTTPPPPTTIRGNQYCEILWGGPLDENQRIPDGLKMTVSWNGFGGKCQSNPGFQNMTAEDIYTRHGEKAELIKFDGVREFLIDESIRQGPPKPMIFDRFGTNINDNGSGLLMLRVAEVLAAEAISDEGNYIAGKIRRDVTFVLHAGKMVYEVVAPNCSAIYTMRSFMIGRPGAWNVRELSTLAEDGRMTLPKGWIYRTRILSEDLIITGTDGVHVVLQDNLENSYSRMDMPHDLSLCPKSTESELDNAGDDSNDYSDDFDVEDNSTDNDDFDGTDHTSAGSSAGKSSSKQKENGKSTSKTNKSGTTITKKKENGASTKKNKEDGTSTKKKKEDGTSPKEKKDKDDENKAVNKVKKEKEEDPDKDTNEKDKKSTNVGNRGLNGGIRRGVRGVRR